jgi:uncharacterized protein DUF3108
MPASPQQGGSRANFSAMIRFGRARKPALANAAWLFLLLATALAAPVSKTGPTGFPFTDETLNYTVSWPTGVTLGEAKMAATHIKDGNGNAGDWDFEITLSASVPGFTVADHYSSRATAELCSLTLEKELEHGSRKAHERTSFDQHAHVARRETIGGGKSDIDVSGCAHDALAFLYYARRELGQGRVPQHETVLFGAPYLVRLEYTGPQSVGAGNKKSEADRIVATLKGPASEITFEMLFARDAARTPLVVRVPLSLGMFSMELAR